MSEILNGMSKTFTTQLHAYMAQIAVGIKRDTFHLNLEDDYT